MIRAKLTKLLNDKKKFTVVVSDGNKTATIHFGDSKYDDYTKHKDPIRLKRYLKRHAHNEDWSDPFTAGFWSRWLLWNKPTIQASVNDIANTFNIKFI